MNTEAFRRLLRWYPRWWRERNGEVLLGTLLSDAQRRGADRPDMGERVSAFVHGLGLRMDVKLAWYCSALALATSAVGAAPANWGVSVSEKWPLYWSAVAALLLGIAWLSWLCRWGLSGPRALLCVLLLGVQVPLSVLAVSRGLETVALDEAWWTAPFFGTDALLRLSVLALMVGICFVATHGVFAHRINGPGWLVVVLATGITVCASPLLSVLALAGTVLPALLTVNWLMCGRQKKTEKPLPGRVPRAIFIIAGALAVPGPMDDSRRGVHGRDRVAGTSRGGPSGMRRPDPHVSRVGSVVGLSAPSRCGSPELAGLRTSDARLRLLLRVLRDRAEIFADCRPCRRHPRGTRVGCGAVAGPPPVWLGFRTCARG